MNEGDGIGHYGEGFESQKIHLQHAEVSQRAHGVLTENRLVGGRSGEGNVF